MLEPIKVADEMLFFFINGKHNYVSDNVAIMLSSKILWLPLYTWLAFCIFKKYGEKIWAYLLSIFILILCSDQLSRLVKNSVMRFRPCHNQTIKELVHIVNNDCGGNYGFVSSHAANSAALATFIILLKLKNKKQMQIIMIAYCFLISVSRIMLGRHYPLDILGGWFIGISLAIVVFNIQEKLVKKNG